MIGIVKDEFLKLINEKIVGIGTVRDVAIDKTKKTIVAQIELIGEDKPVRIKVCDYRLVSDCVIITRFSCDKPWIEVALNKFIAQKEIKLPINGFFIWLIRMFT